MIVVVGSLNLDLVARVARLPAEGETVAASGYAEHAGGKGANQAVAARRAGADVAMVGRVGHDAAGDRLRTGLAAEGVDVSEVRPVDAPTGRALIEVDDAGANRIVVVPGANAAWTERDVPASAVRAASALIVQREVPTGVVEGAVRLAQAAGVPVILNAAPADGFAPELLGRGDLLIVNAHEAASLLGRATGSVPAAEMASALARLGPGDVVVTLGAEGACASGRSGDVRVEGHRVRATDTTAAGDAFVGALAAAHVEGRSWSDALAFATAAGAEAVQREGAQPSLPMRDAIEARRASRG